MKTGNIFLLMTILLGIACQNVQNQKSKTTSTIENKLSSKEYTTNSGKKFIVHIHHSQGASISDAKVETKGFDVVNTTHKMGVIDPIEEIFLADLDKGGFEEIYLVTQTAGSGSYSNIYGIASNKDKSAIPVYVRPVSEKQIAKGGLFEGFMGHNKFSMEDGKLINTFPVYNEGDSNAKPTGGNRRIEYRLIAGETGWILEAFSLLNNN